eukprot:COSAG02_NODE_12672_length_1511_cov_1.482295_1_plen_421_part_10
MAVTDPRSAAAARAAVHAPPANACLCTPGWVRADYVLGVDAGCVPGDGDSVVTMEPPLGSGGSSAIAAPLNEAEAVAEAEVVPEAVPPELEPGHEVAAGRVVAERFTGIFNPGNFSQATSFLHTLYMTPELRAALYRWEGQGERDVSVAYQLQRLFCQMQLAESKTVDPRQLAVALGASDDTQDDFFHDLLNALETCFGGTSVAGAISSLFHRHEEDYLRCAECGGEHCHVVSQRSVSVAVKPFGSPPIASLDEGLDGYCCAEQLNGDSQWFCERCDRKVDAEKGLRLLSAPYILTFALNRFHFDSHAERLGIHNDRVSFPETLDIEKYLLRASKAPAVPVAGAGGEVATGGAGSQQASVVRSGGNSTLGEPATSKLGPAAAGHTSYLAMLLADTLPSPVSQAWPLQAAQRRLAFAMCLRP